MLIIAVYYCYNLMIILNAFALDALPWRTIFHVDIVCIKSWLVGLLAGWLGEWLF
jgi:hypothetical protein